jgi:hypothetical protein
LSPHLSSFRWRGFGEAIEELRFARVQKLRMLNATLGTMTELIISLRCCVPGKFSSKHQLLAYPSVCCLRWRRSVFGESETVCSGSTGTASARDNDDDSRSRRPVGTTFFTVVDELQESAHHCGFSDKPVDDQRSRRAILFLLYLLTVVTSPRSQQD